MLWIAVNIEFRQSCSILKTDVRNVTDQQTIYAMQDKYHRVLDQGNTRQTAVGIEARRGRNNAKIYAIERSWIVQINARKTVVEVSNIAPQPGRQVART